MGKQSALHAEHLAQGARMVDFGGWSLPLQYGLQLEEHHRARRHAEVFDVSHMSVIDMEGPDARAYLRCLLANDIDALTRDSRAFITLACSTKRAAFSMT